MRISTSAVGNYSPNAINRTNNMSKSSDMPQNKIEDITRNERKFFTGLYPEKSAEVMDYHFYQRSGQMGGVKLGSLFDGKG